MINPTKNEKTIGITGASGALGKELTKLFRQKGYKVIGFTHSKTNYEINLESPNEWIKWECCLLYTSPSPRDRTRSRMPSSA